MKVGVTLKKEKRKRKAAECLGKICSLKTGITRCLGNMENQKQLSVTTTMFIVFICSSLFTLPSALG